MIYDEQVCAKDDSAGEHGDVKLQPVSNHAPQQCYIHAPVCIRQLPPGCNQQATDHDAYRYAGDCVQLHQLMKILVEDNERDQRVHQQQQRAEKIECVEIANPSDRQQNVETN